jgi:hypothetical protein
MRGYEVPCEQYCGAIMTSVSFGTSSSSLAQKVKTALEASLPIAEQALRAEALEAGWPSEAANDISVSGFSVSLGDYAATWEFGILGKPPTPVVRSAATTNKIEEVLLKDVSDRLKKEGVL